MIFTVKDNVPQISPEGLFVPEMRNIWDQFKDKTEATKRLCYIYHMADPKSIYNKLSAEEKEKTIIKDFIGDESWTPSALELAAIEKYEKLTESTALRYLRATQSAMDKLSKYITNIQVDENNMKDFALTLEKGEKLITSYQKLLDQIEKEQAQGKRIRGNQRPNIFESE
jgi:hypothetical protein